MDTWDSPEDTEFPTVHQRLIAKFGEMSCHPVDPASLARKLHERCGNQLDFLLFRYEHDVPDLRRELRSTVAKMQKMLAKLMSRPVSPRRSKLANEHDHEILMPHDVVIDQIVALAITDPAARLARGRELMNALHVIALFPLRESLSEDKGRRPGDDSTIEIARALGSYLRECEDQDLCTVQVRTDREQVVTNPRAVRMLKQVFDVLGIQSRLSSITTLVRRAYAGGPNAAHVFD